MVYLITGVAGFIGFHLAKKLLDNGNDVIGIDSLNRYYDINLKYTRLRILHQHKNNFKFWVGKIEEGLGIKYIFENYKIDGVCNLAAYAGVRYSLINPMAYIESNINGFQILIDLVKKHKINSFVYASSSSVYGANEKQPFSEDDPVNNQISLYAVTKRSNELTAQVYNNLYGINCTGLRYFTVYGPYGRPDMALFLFTKNIIEGKPIELFNYGNMERSFTYIDDVINGTISALENPMGNQIFNIGGEENIKLLDYVELIEEHINKKSIRDLKEIQLGDITSARCDISKAKKMLNYKPKTLVKEGIKNFIEWYVQYYEVIK